MTAPDNLYWSRLFNWLAQTTTLSAFEKLLYSRLHGYLGKNSQAWPSTRQLARDLGAAKPNVIRGLKHLEQLGLVHSEPRLDKNDSRLPNVYTFLDHPLMHENETKEG